MKVFLEEKFENYTEIVDDVIHSREEAIKMEEDEGTEMVFGLELLRMSK